MKEGFDNIHYFPANDNRTEQIPAKEKIQVDPRILSEVRGFLASQTSPDPDRLEIVRGGLKFQNHKDIVTFLNQSTRNEWTQSPDIFFAILSSLEGQIPEEES